MTKSNHFFVKYGMFCGNPYFGAIQHRFCPVLDRWKRDPNVTFLQISPEPSVEIKPNFDSIFSTAGRMFLAQLDHQRNDRFWSHPKKHFFQHFFKIFQNPPFLWIPPLHSWLFGMLWKQWWRPFFNLTAQFCCRSA